jgi:hypothetical protein
VEELDRLLFFELESTKMAPSRLLIGIFVGSLVLAIASLVNFENHVFSKVFRLNQPTLLPLPLLPSTPSPSTTTQLSPVDGRVTTYTSNLQSSLYEFHNLCYDTSNNQLQVFTDQEQDMEPFLGKNAIARNVRMNFKFVQMPTKTFPTSLPLFTSTLPVLLFSNDLPAHCLHDYLFTLFLNHPNGTRGQYYLPKTLQPYQIHKCNLLRDWCCFVFHRAQQLRADLIVPIQPTKQAPQICIAHAMFPVFGKGRYAPNWLDFPMFQSPLYDVTGFPLEHLQSLHLQLLHFDSSIVSNRLPQFQLPLPRKRTRLLIIDRTSDRRRVWNNAPAFVQVLTSRWKELSDEKMGQLVYLGTSFTHLSPLEQARLFHHTDVIITPHGAHLSNLIFGVPKQTVAIELTCNVPTPPFGLSWFGTFSTRLGMRFESFSTSNGTVCDHNVKEFAIDPFLLFEFLNSLGIFT